jgi:hypothetical protein
MIKKILFTAIINSIYFSTFAQTGFYLPDGKEIKTNLPTHEELEDSLLVNEAKMYIHPLGIVFFKKLTKKPLYLFISKKINVAKIAEMLAAYNGEYSKYIASYEYFSDLKQLITDGKLDKTYVSESFGDPTFKLDKDEEQIEAWRFERFNTQISFKDDLAVRVSTTNYEAIERNQLAIVDFTVTGEDYTIGFNISVYNKGKKAIKYITFNASAFNPVNDKVGFKSVRGVGPIEPDESGDYEFDDMIYSKSAESISIDNIKIQYMDGTVKIIPKTEVEKIKMRYFNSEDK